MPQLDPTSFASQLFWLTVTFLFLYLMLARFIVPRIAGILEGRQGRIDGDLSAAARFREEAEAARISYEKALQEARSNAQAMIAQAQTQASTEAAARITALDQDMHKKLNEAQQSIFAARDAAMAQMATAAVQLTSQIVEKVSGHKPSNDEVASVIATVSRQRSA